MSAQFKTGQTVATPGAIAAVQEAGESMSTLLNRHLNVERGALPEWDWELNKTSVANEKAGLPCDRVFSAFLLKNGVKVYVITEWDRSVTTVLLPEDY